MAPPLSSRILAAFRIVLPQEHLTFGVGLAATGATAALTEGSLGVTAKAKSNIIPAVAIPGRLSEQDVAVLCAAAF